MVSKERWEKAWGTIIEGEVSQEKNPSAMWKHYDLTDQHQRNYATLRESTKLHGNERVLVPLCGDSPIVKVLVENGHFVTGVELVEVAVERLLGSFPNLQFSQTEDSGLTTFLSNDNHVRIVRGDLFDFKPQANEFDVIYDRAALTAIPPDRRQFYVNFLKDCLRPGGFMFLECFVKDPNAPDYLTGPPWKILIEDEVENLYLRNGFSLVKQFDLEVLSANNRRLPRVILQKN